MPESAVPVQGLRTITRNAVREQISEVAVDLFAERGFDDVTVEQIAAAVGISARSVHRYFPAKEDMVVGEPQAYGDVVRDAFVGCPVGDPVWTSLHTAYQALLGRGTLGARDRAVGRLLTTTPSLRARHLEKHLVWAGLLTPAVVDRLGGEDRHLRAQVIVQASLVCFDIALTSWAEPGESRTAAELVSITFGELDHHRSV